MHLGNVINRLYVLTPKRNDDLWLKNFSGPMERYRGANV